MNNNTPAYLIDASIYIFKYYFSLPDNWWSQNNYPTAAVYGYTHWLFRFLKERQPVKLAACFDESLQNCFRNEIYPHYKSSRVLPDEALAFQLEACKLITEIIGIPVYASDSYEADDLLGTLAKRARKLGLEAQIISRDKDLSQLLSNSAENLWDYPDGVRMDRREVKSKFGVYPEQIPDYLALVGDTIDDIPGVPGIGSKLAAQLLTEFGSWKNMRKNIAGIENSSVRGARKISEKIKIFHSQIDIALKLSTINCNAPLGRRFSLNRKITDYDKLNEFGQYLGFGSHFTTSVKKLRENIESVK